MSTLTLSEAMRLGAMALPPAHGPTITDGPDGRPCGACAIGAALYAIGMPKSTWLDPKVIQALPLIEKMVRDPYGDYAAPVSRIVIHLFESRGWTREAIADWVETIEAQQAQSHPIHDPQEVTA